MTKEPTTQKDEESEKDEDLPEQKRKEAERREGQTFSGKGTEKHG